MISEILKADIESYAARFRATNPLLRIASQGQLSFATVERYLASVHYVLEHTPINLTLARRRAEAAGYTELASYFDSKIVDEAGHAAWAEADMSHLAELSGVAGPRRPERAVVQLMRAVQEAIDRDPFLYLPYILFAEYFTVLMGPEWMSALEEHCGVPSTAMTAVGHHVELDRHHVVDGCREIDALVRDDTLLTPLREMLENTMRQFSVFCDELCAAAA